LNIFFIPTLWAGAVSIVTVLLLAGCIMGLLEGNAHSQ
jgi:hypothetical protein